MSLLPVENIDDSLVTARGHAQLNAELELLTGERRRELGNRLEEARAGGDIADDAALYGVLEDQAQLEQRIAELESQLAAVRIAEPPSDGTAGIGSHVRVRDLESGEAAEYELVGAVETDVGNGRVSVGAPVGRALVGARPGDTVEVQAPRGRIRLRVVDVTAPRPTARVHEEGAA